MMKKNSVYFFMCLVLSLLICFIVNSLYSKIDVLISEKTAKKQSEKKDAKVLAIGSSIDLSRGESRAGKTADMVFRYVLGQQNESDIVCNWVPMDDEYTPAKTLINIEKLLKQRIDIIVNVIGAETFLSLVDFVKTGSILTLFPIPGLADKRTSDLSYCIYFRPSFIQESIVTTSHIADHIKPKNVVLFYQDDAFGKTFNMGAQEVLTKAKIPFVSISYERNDTNFEQTVKQIKTIDPDCIGVFATQHTAKLLFQQLGDMFASKIQFFGSSDLSQSMINSYMKNHKIKCIVSNVVPNPLTSSLPIVREFNVDMKKANIAVDVLALECYIAARLLIDVLKNITGPLNKESIKKAFEEIKNYNFKGLQLNFDPETRQLSDAIWLDTGNGEWIAMQCKEKVK